MQSKQVKQAEKNLEKLWNAYEQLKDKPFNLRMICEKCNFRPALLDRGGLTYAKFKKTVRKHPNYYRYARGNGRPKNES